MEPVSLLIALAAMSIRDYIKLRKLQTNVSENSNKPKFISIECLPNIDTTDKSTSNHFHRIIKKFEEEKYFDLAQEIKKLLSKYEKPDDMASDFEKYVNALNISLDCKDDLIYCMREIKRNLENLNDNMQSSSKTNEILKAKGIPRNLYDTRIEGIYSKMTINLRNDYNELINRCCLIYMKICSLNYKLEIIPKGQLDAGLIYMIAGRAKDKSGLSCIKNKTKDQLAYDISDAIKKIYGINL